MKWEVMGYIILTQDSDSWRTLVNAVMKFGSHKLRRIS